MNGVKPVDQPSGKPGTTGGVVRWLAQSGVLILILAASLFISSGSLGWAMAWVLVGLYAASTIVQALVLIPNNPELLAERTGIKLDPTKKWDRPLAGIVSLWGPVATQIVAGLNVRFGWSPQTPFALQVAAVAIAVLGMFLSIWAMASNRFFYGFVRIEKDRGHTVATGGPYRYVRHPGYAGGILFALATPLILGALWAFIPAVLTMCLLVVRTALEDRTLQDELDGYAEYAQQTRYRLLPGVW